MDGPLQQAPEYINALLGFFLSLSWWRLHTKPFTATVIILWGTCLIDKCPIQERIQAHVEKF